MRSGLPAMIAAGLAAALALGAAGAPPAPETPARTASATDAPAVPESPAPGAPPAPETTATEPPPTGAAAFPGVATTPGRQGILLVTIDSLRADHVGCYGATMPVSTPAIDRLAASGVRFDRAYTVSVSSTAAAASVVTGVLPSAHGLRDDLGGRMAEGVPTVADRLRAAGWATAASIGTNHLGLTHGLSGGFDVYDDDIKGLRKLGAGLSRERRASEVAERALVALDALPKAKPYFLWAHFHDPHYDYDPAEPQKSAFKDAPYDGEVAAVDEAVGALVRNLRDRAPGGRLLVVVAATHGEAFGDQKEYGHGFYVNETTTRVPLVIAGGARRTSGLVVEEPVSLIDIAPTLLEFAGVAAAAGPAAALPGIALDAALHPGDAETDGRRDRGRGKAPARRIYVEAAAPATAYGWSPLFSVTEGHRRVVRGERLEAFDLLADPAGRTPLPSAPRWSKELVEHGRALFGSLEAPADRRRAIDAEVAKQDYPWNDSPFCAPRNTFPDPRDAPQIEVQEPLYFARVESEQGIVGRAWKRAEPVLAKDPGNPAALVMGVIVGLRLKWGTMLEDYFEILTCQYPYRWEGYHYLGHYHSVYKSWEKALAAFELMRLADPENEEAYYDLACTYAAMGRKDEAFARLRQSIEKGGRDFDFMRRDGRLLPLRSDPRFAEIIPAAVK